MITMLNNNETIIRAWKDKSFRAGLPANELAKLPTHPAGSTELTEVELNTALGGIQIQDLITDTDFSLTCGFLCGTSDWWC